MKKINNSQGPFTTADNLSYQPFEDLLRIALKSKPDLLILVGPFVDISHPQLSSGWVTAHLFIF